jgi:arylsulfatase A-like enzyme
MHRITKINIGVFSILTIITIFISFMRYRFSENFSILLMTISFNIFLGFLVILTVHDLVKMSKRGFRVFIFYMIIVSFFYWYITSSLLNFYYGSFLSLNGFYYLIATRTYFAMILFFVGSALLILVSSFVLFYFTKRYVFEETPTKVMRRDLKFLIILTPIIVLILILIIIPKGDAHGASPILDAIYQFVSSGDLEGGIAINESEGGKIFNETLDIEKPNIIFIMMESISSEHLPVYGYEKNISPNIDSLAEKSKVFNNSYSTSSHSDYAQTAFLSSRYMLINSYRNFFDKDYPRVFIWDILKEQGNYTTAYISSQDDNWANMIDYYKKKNLDVYNYSLSDEKYDYGSGNARKDYDEYTIEDSVSWINQTSQPFFLYVNLQASHYPYEYPKNNSVFTPDEPSVRTSYFDIPQKDYEASVNDYDNSIYYVDKQIGILLDFLKNKSLFNNSIIVLSADHGEILEKRHENLRHGFGVYEEEVRTPLIIYIPNEEPELITQRVGRINVVPTLLDITGFNLSEEFQGKPMRENQEIFLMVQNQKFQVGLIKNNIKYVLNLLNEEAQAYNLTEDPLEQNNLIKTNKDKRFYYYRYGYTLYQWYNCQKKYYKKDSWEKGKVIDC